LADFLGEVGHGLTAEALRTLRSRREKYNFTAGPRGHPPRRRGNTRNENGFVRRGTCVLFLRVLTGPRGAWRLRHLSAFIGGYQLFSNWRAITSRWISLVPSPMVQSFTSR
jgi:hypothetical protein